MIIPTFNRRERLLAAVSSVQRQTFRDWELVVVDDGSQDGTEAAMEPFLCRHIRYLRQPHQGVSAARNRGLAEARFDWVAFLDSDDTWHPRKLHAQWEAVQDRPGYGVVHTDEIWIRHGVRVNARKKHRKYGGWIFHHCLRLCLISPSSILIQRRLLDRCGLFDETYPVCEDYELWLRLTARWPVLYLPETLITKHGGHSDQLSRSGWGLDRHRVRALLKSLRSGLLTPQQERWVKAEIRLKSRILEVGYDKHGKPNGAAYYRLLQRLHLISESPIPENSGVVCRHTTAVG